MEERDKRKISERRPHAQRPKRIHADTTPREDEHEVSLEAIRARISGLQERHLQLRETLSKPEKAQGAKLAQEFDEARANSSEGTYLESSSWNDALLETIFEQAYSENSSESERNDTGRLLYHIGRKAIFILSNRRIGIEFTPAFSEQEQERYYCVLTTKPPSNKIFVSKDNIPFYLNLREIEKTHLQLSATNFLDHVDSHLQAFVCRRGQILGLKQLHGDSIGDLYHSLPYNLITFSLDEPTCKADVELAFDNLASEYPTRCTVLVWSLAHPGRKASGRRGTRSQQASQAASIKVSKAEELLRMKLLPDAYDDLVKEIQAAAMAEA
ncbi:hypothetical protein SELMODRAFT_150942 [Selaginella moellendorffii]|uniref:Centromere protein O n=1 Tax=Selaginella moellendorffii TaxID=88036 RepID=D8RXZ9_SELML|nr:uncharacterized protein LOC9646201 isoform X1 [Selaginella moellendorffii]EFJ22820.1 hypothetical protein SELMODRAFT_150942 [Selaginella moellendorffii]|eukprot:XP_002975915.1 uncharacterized protein LOC9646201 isoform X1 [Selaginella moellendorffii]